MSNYLIFVERPIALGLVLVAVLLLTLSAVSFLRRRADA
jgi:TctA family transporter